MSDERFHIVHGAALPPHETGSEDTRNVNRLNQFVGEIVHEFNNLLTTIAAHAELLDESLAAPNRNDAVAILQACRSGRELVRQLLALARPESSINEPIDLNQFVQGRERIVRQIIGEKIELIQELHSEPLLVHVAYWQLEQLLINLVMNARDAMTGTGQLMIRTSRALKDGSEQVGLQIVDNGIGMDEFLQQNVFEPFFTTKESMAGSGLGLTIVRQIVQETSGRIEVASRPSAGTTMSVWWPRASA